MKLTVATLFLQCAYIAGCGAGHQIEAEAEPPQAEPSTIYTGTNEAATGASEQTIEDLPVVPPSLAPSFALPDLNGRYQTIIPRSEYEKTALIFVNAKQAGALQNADILSLKNEGFRLVIIDQTRTTQPAKLKSVYASFVHVDDIFFDAENYVANKYSIKVLPSIALINDGDQFVEIRSLNEAKVIAD